MSASRRPGNSTVYSRFSSNKLSNGKALEPDAAHARLFTRRLRTALNRLTSQDVVRLPKNGVLYSCGDPSNSLYLVESGRIKEARYSPCGKVCVLDIYGPGEVIGECCLQEPQRLDTATAMVASLARRIPLDRFLDLLLQEHLLEDWMRYLAARLSTQQRLITLLVTMESEQRLAAILLRLARKLGIPQDEEIRINERITQQELAEMVGTTRSRVGFFLKRFRDSGFVRPAVGSRLVVNEPRLAAYVGDWS